MIMIEACVILIRSLLTPWTTNPRRVIQLAIGAETLAISIHSVSETYFSFFESYISYIEALSY